jgi:hypothetical protein
VLLRLAFRQQDGEPVLVQEPPVGGCHHAPLEEARIRKAVLDGVAEARQTAGFSLYAAEILYVADDSPRYDIYQHCAYLLAQRPASGAEFVESSENVG